MSRIIPTLSLTLLLLCSLASCSDETTQQPNYVTVSITQPTDGQVLTDSLVRVLTTMKSNCGCSAKVDFYVDSVLHDADYVPEYSCDITLREYPPGPHRIIAHAVVFGKAEDRDTITVDFQPR